MNLWEILNNDSQSWPSNKFLNMTVSQYSGLFHSYKVVNVFSNVSVYKAEVPLNFLQQL